MASVLENIAQDFEALAQMQECPDDDTRELVQSVSNLARKVEQEARSGSKTGGYWHEDFSFTDIEGIIAAIESMGDHLEIEKAPPVLGEDIPKYFDVESLPDYVKAIAADRGSRDLAQFVDSLELRLRGLLSRGRLSSVLMPPDSSSIQLDEWLTEYIGDNQASNGQIVVLDLSLVPSDVVHVVVASLARLVFEAVQRYRRLNSQDLPTVLILEEAHTFVHRDLSSDHATPAGRACYSTFERIAREGRKFGLGLVLSSQRPSEMSPTVLSQCNTFLLHRIVNDLDQRLVRRLVPDALGSLLQELPSLPTRRAILLGWATPAPTLVEIKELSVDDRPQSPDPRFWEVWTGALERTVDWKSVATDWQGDPAEAPGEDSDPTEPSAQPSQ